MEYIGDYSHPRNYYMVPEFIFNLDMTHTAMVLYGRLYSRCFMSLKNNIVDADGHAYCFYPVDDMALDMRCSKSTIMRALDELEKYDLIDRRKTQGINHIYAKYAFLPYGEHIKGDELAALMIVASEGNMVQ